MTNKIHKRCPEDSSAHFFFILVGIGLFSIGLILLLAGYGLNSTIRSQIYSDAEEDAERVTRAILRSEEGYLFRETSPGLWQLRFSKEELAEFDTRMRHLLQLFEISKIKIFDDNHRVVYSTDASIIGLRDSENPRLARSLGGFIDSSLKYKESMVDLAEEERFDVDVVETYIPISMADGQVIGSMEIYKDISRYRQAFLSLFWKNISILALVLFLVFAPSMLIVRALTRRLSLVQAQLKEQASIDALTGILNHGEIMARGAACVAGPSPLQRQDPLNQAETNGIMMIDIDHFKQINDTLGHLVGDLVLKALAKRLAAGLRQEDLVGRYGGEEFLLVLPNSSLETSRALGERIRKSIAEAPFTCDGHHLSVTVSVGVSCCPRGDEQEFLLALEDADQGLYLAKNCGRNQVRGGPRSETWGHDDPGTCPGNLHPEMG
ncbi:MAG: diguanylate cyclase [Desulfoarculaceae bacterium]|nr:diguanylate cyclase [Desulfoarculaceae bacterium]